MHRPLEGAGPYAGLYRRGDTPLHLVAGTKKNPDIPDCHAGFVEAAKFLVEFDQSYPYGEVFGNEDMNMVLRYNKDGLTPLHLALENQNWEVAREILKHPKQNKDVLLEVDADDPTPYHTSVFEAALDARTPLEHKDVVPSQEFQDAVMQVYILLQRYIGNFCSIHSDKVELLAVIILQ